MERPRVEYPEDCRRIQRIANQMGYSCSIWEAEAIWNNWSNHSAAGWLCLPEDGDAEIEAAVTCWCGSEEIEGEKDDYERREDWDSWGS